jgi:hypothetical protein
MKRPAKTIIAIIAGCSGVGAVGAAVAYHFETINNVTRINNATPPAAASMALPPQQTVPSPTYLAANPAAFKLAQGQCQADAVSNPALCDNVRKAGALMLANQYGNAASGKPQ